jgi:type II secretory pathway predicted ATPase ExeA
MPFGGIVGYTEYFNLEREPFSNAPNDKFFFNSDQHNQALLRLMYAVDSNKGLAVLVGGAGTGKTTLARRMLDDLTLDKYESSLLVMIHSGITPEWILSRIALQLGVKSPDSDPLKILKQLYERLLQIHKEGRKAVVLIDEAQMLQSRELMEEFRGLLNLEIPGKKLLNVVFFGLPELEQTMKLDEPLAQRVAVKFTLKPLSVETTHGYIAHRLNIAGTDAALFEESAIDSIHMHAGGVPRLINTIADNALFETFLRQDNIVSDMIIDSVSEDLGLNNPEAGQVAEPAAIEPVTSGAQPSLAGEDTPEDLEAIDSMLDGLQES